MCGIAGIVLAANASEALSLDAIGPMMALLRHRGPDGDGIWSDSDAGIALGHRRLAIVDLSDAGRQPMRSANGRLIITFNGEVYNFGALRRELESLGHGFRGGSDTEVMLAAIECWGLEPALQRFSGMFAFALWDRAARVLHLARDRIGKKPLYVARLPGALVFASELKALRTLPHFRPEIDRRAVAAMLARGCVPDDLCIWNDVFKLPPGAMLSLSAADIAGPADTASLKARISRWWSLAAVAERGRRDPCALDDGDMVAELDGLLRLAVGERMVADVPLGAFLSGGIDSSTVVALMQAQANRPVRTFTIAFGERGYDESVDAGRIARHLGTDHTELRLSPAEARTVIPELPRIWDEPFADESQIPTLLVSRLARTDVTVALSGDGGDECFAGYSRHFLAARLAPLLRGPSRMRRTAAAALDHMAGGTSAWIVDKLPLPNALRRAIGGDRLRRLAELLAADDTRDMYRRLTRLSSLCLARDAGPAEADAPPLDDLVSELIFRDMAGYLPDDILVKLDRASMATSLEARCPLLDHRIIEFAWRLPTAAKVRHGQGKWILRQVLARYVPRALFERPKQGFDVPVGAWLKGPLRAWAEDLLTAARLRRHDLLEPVAVRSCWQEHLSGRRDHSRVLWAVLMLEAWLDESTAPGAAGPINQLEPILQGS
ncbi:asparagine synthase (glutamine-hydrolyzing) [Phreatobacter stygius]|uniref:asparagine synthase (glutamine-hydrolyzing) n=1 Tax=Phreatobacter stygius TaxID=1940610 RepID=A0A4D7B4Q5_9HYPH|nr:asparagine synthase (glutamine-hydrolyzing) [Phreatobacter stygius]QCI68414.1 asparagine synthase (glutamine-hydrolyzing) [Phreatobacter stygius]